MYPISTTSEILRQGSDSLAQWFESHQGRGSFQTMHH